MTSNVYIAQGIIREEHLMKVGKANDVKKRQESLRITIEHSCPMSDPFVAFLHETMLRRFARHIGAIQHELGHDWFIYCDWQYEAIRNFMMSDFQTNATVISPKISAIENQYQYLFTTLNAQHRTITQMYELLIRQLHSNNAESEQLLRQLIEVTSERAAIERELSLIREGWLPPIHK